MVFDFKYSFLSNYRYKYRELHPDQDEVGVTVYADDVQVAPPKRICLDLSLHAQCATPVPPP